MANQIAGVRRPPSTPAVEISKEEEAVIIKVDGRVFGVYNFGSRYASLYKPFFYPLMGPNQKPITQNGEFPGSLRGHYWWRSLFIGHQRVNGVSFWEEREGAFGRIVHLGFDELFQDDEGRFVERLAWREPAGNDLLQEVRTVRVPKSVPQRRLLDITVKLTAVHEEVRFAATPYSLLACLVINPMRLIAIKQHYVRRFGSLLDLSPVNEGGRITNSEGKQNDDCRGARAKWCDSSGPLGDGTWGGVAILDHPSNLRHPTPWNDWPMNASFTLHEPFTLKKGQELSLGYRVVVHSGDARKADIEGEWKAFSQSERAGL